MLCHLERPRKVICCVTWRSQGKGPVLSPSQPMPGCGSNNYDENSDEFDDNDNSCNYSNKK